GQKVSDSLIEVIGYGSVAFSSVLSLVIIVVLAVMLHLLNKGQKVSDSLIEVIGYGSVAFSSVLSLVIIVVLAV
ncbi:hypothetical protein HT105_25385, partial [Bacteroides fragilis]|nr:hypothetical protein [Bacteroides fragilis]